MSTDLEAWIATEQWRAYVDAILRRDFRFDRWAWEGQRTWHSSQ